MLYVTQNLSCRNVICGLSWLVTYIFFIIFIETIFELSIYKCIFVVQNKDYNLLTILNTETINAANLNCKFYSK